MFQRTRLRLLSLLGGLPVRFPGAPPIAWADAADCKPAQRPTAHAPQKEAVADAGRCRRCLGTPWQQHASFRSQMEGSVARPNRHHDLHHQQDGGARR
jgi:hypothetical protein